MFAFIQTVHSLSIYVIERRSEQSKQETCGEGGVGFASKAGKQNRENVDIFGRKWTS